MVKFLLNAVALLAVLNACSFKKSDQADVLVTGDRLIENDFRINDLPEPEFDSYRVRVSWPEEKKVSVAYRIGDITTLVNRTNYFDVPCSQGRTVELTILHQPQTTLATISQSFKIQHQCPKDIHVSGITKFVDSDRHLFGRVLFDDSSTLDLDGQSFIGTVDSLIVGNKARIDSYLARPAISNQTDQRIDLQVRRARGMLQVSLRGLPGRRGREGAEIRDEKMRSSEVYRTDFTRARNGRPGANAVTRTECTQNTKGDYGRERCQLVCVKMAQQGSPGLDGFPGEDGEDGQPGIPTPYFRLKVDHNEGLTLGIEYILGAGGEGGLGTAAVAPGIGGASGSGPSDCVPRTPRRDGRPAADGKKGAPGGCGSFVSAILQGEIRALENVNDSLCKRPMELTQGDQH